MVSRCLGSVALVAAGVEGARVSRKREGAPATKFIAGVPVLNYHAAYEGVEVLVEGETEGEWVVMANPGTSDEQINRMCRKATPHGCKLAGHPSEGGVPFLEMRGTEKDLEAVIKSSPGVVKYVEPDQTVHMIPEMESPEAATWGLNRVNADQRSRSGSSATVFVLDTGVRVSHNDFGGRATPALDMTVGAPKECNGDVSCAADRQGHGTHCAGTAAGETLGVAPGAKVASVKVLSDRGSGSWSWSYYALDWMAKSSVRPAVASMSLGGRGTQTAMRDAVDAAVTSGVVVVVAGGNSNMDACGFSPAFVESAITVGSTTSTDTRSSFSNYGSCTNIWAPGSSVVSASHRSDTGTTSKSGTSMACPHVSGAAALVLDADPSKAASKVLAELLEKATKDALTGLRTGDTNSLLNVADVAALVESASGACTSSSDRDIIDDRFDSLVGDVRGCVISCIGSGKGCATNCAKGFGFSTGCATCVANLGNCAKSNCLLNCINPNSAGCTSCTVNKCYGDLVTCTGLPVSELPRP